MRGVSLLELLATLCLVGILAALGGQRVAMLRDRVAVEAAATDILTAYQRARLDALRSAAPVRLEVAATWITAWSRTDGDSSRAWAVPGPAIHGVALRDGMGPVVMLPAGITMGVANGRYVLERGSARQTLIASRLGRLRVSRPRRRQSPSRSSSARPGSSIA